MERDSVQLVDDNCSQIEVAFKRMKVGTSRCTNKKNHHHIYNQSKHYHHHHSQQLIPQQQQPQQQPNHQQQDQQQPNQVAQHPDVHPNQSNTNQVSPNTIRVNPYYNQMFNTNTRVITKTFDNETVDSFTSVDKSETISFSSFSASPLALLNSFPSNTRTSSSSVSSSSTSAVTPPLASSNSMGPYRDVIHLEGQTDNFQNYNQTNNNSNHHHEDGPPADPDVSVEELAAYLDVQLYIPRKMSYMAELMYT